MTDASVLSGKRRKFLFRFHQKTAATAFTVTLVLQVLLLVQSSPLPPSANGNQMPFVFLFRFYPVRTWMKREREKRYFSTPNRLVIHSLFSPFILSPSFSEKCNLLLVFFFSFPLKIHTKVVTFFFVTLMLLSSLYTDFSFKLSTLFFRSFNV